MKLNKSIHVIAICLVINTITGCSEWLDYTPKDQQIENQQFSSRQGFYAAVNGVYNRLTSTILYGENLTYGALDCMGKRYNTGTDNTRTAYLWAQYDYTNKSISANINYIWGNAYATILNVNVILKNLETRKNILSTKDYQVIKGDLLSLRAFLHLDMLRLFGPVYSRKADALAIPYNDSEDAKSYTILSAKDIIYNHLIPDLTEAEKTLKEADPVLTEGVLSSDSENGDNFLRYRQLRLNYYATVLLKARAYLWAGDKKNAAIEARKITDDPQIKSRFPFVNPDKLLGNTTDPDRAFSTEVLFGFYNTNKSNIYISTFDGANLSQNSLLQPRGNYIDLLYSKADYRYASLWTQYGEFYNLVKYKGISIDLKKPPFYTYLMPLIHLSEAYYIASEALIETDPGAAITYLNTILNARGLTQIAANTQASAVIEEIQKEYMREMIGEGQIFFMMKRFYLGMADIYNAESTNNVVASEARYVLPLPESEQTNR